MPPIGRLRDRVEFREPFDQADGAGGTTRGWLHAFYRQGELVTVAGQESREAGRLESRTPATLTIRYSRRALTITSEWQALVNGVEYQIRAIVDPTRRRRWLQLTLEQGSAQ